MSKNMSALRAMASNAALHRVKGQSVGHGLRAATTLPRLQSWGVALSIMKSAAGEDVLGK